MGDNRHCSFSEYRKNGDRMRFQAFTYAKRNQLAALAMAEIMEGKGRFMKDILNGLFSLCEETWWGVPAHYGPNIPLVEISRWTCSMLKQVEWWHGCIICLHSPSATSRLIWRNVF